jgi:hypothetical protein
MAGFSWRGEKMGLNLDSSRCAPAGLAIDTQAHVYVADFYNHGEGNIYVADAYNYRVQKWPPAGHFLAVWGGQGSAQEQFDVPSGIAVDGNGVVHIADSANYRLVGRTTEGTVGGRLGDERQR